MRSQDSFEVYFSAAVTDLTGRDAVHRWLTNLWPVTCQTCSEPLGTKADLSGDALGDGKVLLSMHHSACRPSGTTPADEPVTMYHPTSSFVVGYLARPGWGPSRTDIPVMVVNPSCEQLALARESARDWRNATLDEFTTFGLAPATDSFPPEIPQIHAALCAEHLTVAVTADQPVRHEWTVDPPPHVCEQLRRHRGFAIALTTKVLPTLLLPEDLPAAFADPEAITSWVNLDRSSRRWR